MKKMKKTTLILFAIVFTMVFYSCENKNDETKDKLDTTEHNHEEKDKKSKGGKACGMPLTAEDSTKFHVSVLKITGEVENQLSLTVDSLKAMNVIEIDSFKVVCQSGATTTPNVSLRGVLLKEILEKAKVIQQGHKDRNFYIVAKASDNYKATFSWAEIFNNPTGENTYVVFEENNNPIVKGDFVLNCTNDIKTGPRHVYWLNEITVYRVE